MTIATRGVSEEPGSGKRATERFFDLGVECEIVVSGLPQHDGLGEVPVRDPPDVADRHTRSRFVHEIPKARDGIDEIAGARVRNDRLLKLTANDDRPSCAQVGQRVVRVASSIDNPNDQAASTSSLPFDPQHRGLVDQLAPRNGQRANGLADPAPGTARRILNVPRARLIDVAEAFPQ
jgi:hypothetical protein